MKLLLINYEFPPLGGGAGNATKNIARELAKDNHNVTVLTTWYEELEETEVNGDGVMIYRIKSKRQRKERSSPIEMFDFVRKAKVKARELVKESKPDAVISFFALPTGLVAYDLFKKFQIPYIVSLRGGDVPGFLPKELWLMHMISTPFTNMVWKYAHTIVANSKDLQTLAQKTANKFKKEVLYIPNGVDGSFFMPEMSKESEDQKFKVLCVGRLVEQKRFHRVITACARMINENNKDIEVHIVGDGPLKKELMECAATNGITEKVHFHGWLDKNELRKKYQESNVFVLPSIDEGMPNVVLEAMASGLPIIASNVSGNNELIEDGINGYFAESEEELFEKISALEVDREKCKKMGEMSREISKKFDWIEVARGYIHAIISA